MGKLHGVLGTVCCAVIIAIIVIVAMSFKRVETNTVAVAYNTVSRNLGDEVVEEGLKLVGPSMEMIVFETTQRQANEVDIPALSRDSIRVTLDVQVLFTVQKEHIFDILDKYYDEEGQTIFLRSYVTGITRVVASTFTAKQFFLRRTDFQRDLFSTITARALRDNVTHVRIDSVQVLSIDLPASVLSAMEASTVAEQDITNAASERTTRIQAASIGLDRARSEAELVLIDAARDVAVIEQATAQAISVERELQATRADAFSNISTGLGFGGDFFVQSYLKYLVLQSNEGSNIIGL
jgi:regulator of protease activity HflC (stomatin/prohibitin superfamily)